MLKIRILLVFISVSLFNISANGQENSIRYNDRIGEYKDINIASQKLEEIRRIYPSSFIIKLSDL